VFWVDKDDTVGKVRRKNKILNFSRIPLYDPIENKVTGIVLRSDIHKLIAEKKLKTTIRSISIKPYYVPESISVLKLMNNLITEKRHIAVAINEYGDYTGIVTLEDAIETLLGEEIVDEDDLVADMRELAEQKSKKK